MKNSIVFVLVTALAIAAIAAGDANVSVACDGSKTATAKAKSSDCSAAKTAALTAAECEKACAEAAAAVTAGKNECCKAAVAAAMKACPYMAGTSASGCTRSATASAHSAGCCKSSTATASLKECCRETLAAYHAAVKKNLAAHAGVVWTSSSCSRSAVAGTGCKKATKSAATADAKKSGCGSATAAFAYADISGHEGKRVVLTGHPACAKCTFHSSDACEALFQTEDGKIYRVLKNNHYAKMQNTESENGFKVTTRVRKLDGVKYLEIETQQAL